MSLLRQIVALSLHLTRITQVRNAIFRVRGQARLIVVAYHRVNDDPEDKNLYTLKTSVFDAQMNYLSKNYYVTTFQDVLRMVEKPALAKDCLVITFDDGYEDNFTNAVPILMKYGLKACFFITTDIVRDSDTASVKEPSARFPGMTISQIQQLSSIGFEIGAHTCSHRNLADLPIEIAGKEMTESKGRLEKLLNHPIEYFAYPGGKRNEHFNDDVKSIAASHFRVVCSTTRASNTFRKIDSKEVHRICVQRWWSLFYFKRELEGIFDFVGSLNFQ